MTLFQQSTLLLFLVAFTLLTTLLLVAAALPSDALKEQRLWAVGNVCASVGLVLSAIGALPVLVHGAVSYGLMGLGLALILRGLRRFCGQDLADRWVLAIALLSLLVPAYFVLVQPSLNARLVVSGVFMGALNLLCAGTLVRGASDAVRPSIWTCVAGFVVLGTALVLRGAYLAVVPLTPEDSLLANTVMSATLFMIPLAQVAVSFGLTLMVARRYAERLRQLTQRDGLTGALNRAALQSLGLRVLARARQSNRSVVLAMIDADHFKVINDTYGHPVGDEVLRHLVNLLTVQVRPADLVARYGGEEFVLVMDGLSLAGGMAVAERLRGLVEQATLVLDGQQVRYQVSIGLCSTDACGYDLAQLVSMADMALYQAKQQGRNRVSAGENLSRPAPLAAGHSL